MAFIEDPAVDEEIKELADKIIETSEAFLENLSALFGCAVDDLYDADQKEMAATRAYNKALSGLFGGAAIDGVDGAEVVATVFSGCDAFAEVNARSAVRLKQSFVGSVSHYADLHAKQGRFVEEAADFPDYIKALEVKVRQTAAQYGIKLG